MEIRREGDALLVTPVADADPLMELGKHPATDSITDASEHHDRYLHGR